MIFATASALLKRTALFEVAVLENSIREDLNEHAVRVMGVLNPLKVTIENYPDDQTEKLVAQNHPQKPEMGTRDILFSKSSI